MSSAKYITSYTSAYVTPPSSSCPIPSTLHYSNRRPPCEYSGTRGIFTGVTREKRQHERAGTFAYMDMVGGKREEKNRLHGFDIPLHLPITPFQYHFKAKGGTYGTHQSVTASSQSLTSCSLVPPKCSTNSSPKTSLATLSFLINLAFASFSDFANLTPASVSPPTSSPFPSGGSEISIFFSTPRQPRARMAASTKNGFASAPATRISKRVAFGEAVGGAISRMEAARCSRPQETVTGAQKFSTRRL